MVAPRTPTEEANADTMASMKHRSRAATSGAPISAVLANAEGVDKDAFFRQLMVYGGLVVLLAPLGTWLVLVVPGWL